MSVLKRIHPHVLGTGSCPGKAASAVGLVLFSLASVGWTIPAVCDADVTLDYQGPCAIVASQDGKTLYVASTDAREVAWVDLPTSTITRRVPVPSEPTGLALTPDGKMLTVTCAAPKSTVAVLDVTSGDQVSSIPAGHTAMSPVISPDGKRLYICNRFDNDVSVIELPDRKEISRVPAVREPIAAAVTPNGHSLLVANHLPNTRTDRSFDGDVTPIVTVIDTRTLKATAIELLHGAHSLRDLCVSPDGKQAFVTHLLGNFQEIPFRVDMGWINVNVLSVIDLTQHKVISTIGMDDYDLGAGNPYNVTCAADGKTVCVTLAGTHELCVIDTEDLLSEFAYRTMQPMMGVWPIYLSLGESLWRRIPLPGKGPRGLTAVGTKVYVAQYFSDSIAAVDVHIKDNPKYNPEAIPPVDTIALGPLRPLTLERRGELLFHDATICYQHWVSCASCHPDGREDSLNWDLMNDGGGNPKNTKSLLLSHKTPPSMAEGVRATAEVAVRSGLTHILFSDRPEEDAAAIDAYLKSLQPVASPYLVEGQLSPAAKRGQTLFRTDSAGCQRCHPPPTYTDLRSHNVGSRHPKEFNERFDTPSLVEVWRTAPYLHDGRYTTIRELLVDGKHGLPHDRANKLTDQDINDLIEFVLSL